MLLDLRCKLQHRCNQLHRPSCQHRHITRVMKCVLAAKECSPTLQGQQARQQQHLPHLACQQGALLNLDGRTVGIFWDLDNLAPSSIRVDLIPAVRELQGLLTVYGGSVQSVRMYANAATYARLDASLQQQLCDADCQLIQVPVRNQAADMQLSADVYSFIQTHGHQGCIVCVSKDQGFADILNYAAGRGVVSIVMTTFTSPTYYPSLLPNPAQQQLPQVCHAAFAWQPGAGAAARKRQQKQQQMQQSYTASKGNGANGSSSSSSSRSCTSGSGSTSVAGRMALPNSGWHVLPATGNEGSLQFIEAVWINPKITNNIT